VVGPKAVPIAIGVALGAASLALAIRGFLKGRSPRDAASGDEAPPQDLRKLGVVALILLAYILIFVPLGYAISTFLFMLAATMYLDRERWVRNLIYAVVFSAVVYSIFVYVFGVQLPAGILG
jgi:putative tricarboxylic transport membrane protein